MSWLIVYFLSNMVLLAMIRNYLVGFACQILERSKQEQICDQMVDSSIYLETSVNYRYLNKTILN